jgi:uncharacterized membrane protein
LRDQQGGSIEMVLGFVLGVPAMVLGYWLLANSCGVPFDSLPGVSSCHLLGSTFAGVAGIVLMLMGTVVVVASIAVLAGRK